jgi:hypothetical protein
MATNNIELQLGDIIQIFYPLNQYFNEQIFIIDYIDKTKLYLINTDTLKFEKLSIHDGVIGDGNITEIAILNRSDTPSYARQNDLLPDTWIDIHFGGDFPAIISGEITNLEEDMIEVTTIDGDVLYINFDYKGIPEDLPISKFVIREKPVKPVLEEVELQEVELQDENIDNNSSQPIPIPISVNTVKNTLREFIIQADQIKFGDEKLGNITQYVDVSNKQKIYSIEEQVSDLLDELLSTIPNHQRTAQVLNNIYITIERFKILREKLFIFDKFGNIQGTVKKQATYKPLINYFQNFKQNLYWILPVVKNVKKIYNIDDINENNNDIINVSFEQALSNLNNSFINYKSNNTLNTDSNNKYTTLYNEINQFFTPFDLINSENVKDILIEKVVNNEITTIIDNLEDMYSSVYNNKNVVSRRFVIQKYNLGLTKLDTINSTNSRLITKPVFMTPSDTMSIKSFITLPEPVIRFSKINLPSTTLLDRTNLNQHFIHYWQLLKKKTPINTVFVDNPLGNTEINFNETNFANNIKNYVLNTNEFDTHGLSKLDIYDKFIDIITPKTKVLFKLMKKYIIGNLSVVAVVSYLEPFLIYTDDLTYMQYVEIIKFINEQISKYNRTFIERSRVFVKFSKVKSANLVQSNAFSVVDNLSQNNSLRGNVCNAYNLDRFNKSFTNSEFLFKILLKDYNRLYTITLALQNVYLMFPDNMSSLFDEEKIQLNQSKSIDDKCKTIIIAKYYSSLDSLTADNNTTIYFDKKYDKTNYSAFVTNYEKEIMTMSPEQLKKHIVQELIQKKKFTEDDANYLADTYLDGYKKVLDGQYAILYKGYNENILDESDYYVRKNNQWILDNSITNDIKTNSDDNSILCNLQTNCVNILDKIDDKCESISENKLQIQSKFLQTVVNEFDTKYKLSKTDFTKLIQSKFDYYLDLIPILTKIQMNKLLKYNFQKYKLGSTNGTDALTDAISSPSSQLLNLILAQTDFIKKQNDIVRFVNMYTRPANNTTFESNHWLYCSRTNIPLLPVFKFELAAAYLKSTDTYIDCLEQIKASIGTKSDEGDWWCDKFTGWPIVKVDFDVEEGFEEGFKVSTRSVLENDIEMKVVSVVEIAVKYDTPQTKMIDNIIKALSNSMGINIESQKDFIMNCVLIVLKTNLETEDDYKEKINAAAAKGKEIPPYKFLYNTTILFTTLASFLIAVQTAIPSVKTRKTFTGCIKSFIGYPFQGTGDFSALNYLSCIAYNSRQSSDPWNALQRLNPEKIANKLKGVIDTFLYPNPDIKNLIERKYEEKTDYLLTNDINEIPMEHDIANWTQFLPPLVPFKILNLHNISNEFKDDLARDLKSGSKNQYNKILIIKSKIIFFSLALQEFIQNVLHKKATLLNTSNNEPYIENACCETNDGVSTIQYFINKNKDIGEYNTIVTKLTNYIADIQYLSKGLLFFSNIDTKNKYPTLSTAFNERIIYLSFIHFCKFKSFVPIPTSLLPYCQTKPASDLINFNDSVDIVIQKLKNDGKNYTEEQFLKLLQIVSRNNIVDFNFQFNIVSSITKLKSLLDNIVFNQQFKTLINNSLDTFSIANETSTPEMKQLNNFLIRSIDSMKNTVSSFFKTNNKNITTQRLKPILRFIDTVLTETEQPNWSTDKFNYNYDVTISNDRLYTVTNFYNNYIHNFALIFPNIILNKVDYKSLSIPSYYGFSTNHNNKLKRSINGYYEKLYLFFNSPILQNFLSSIQDICNNVVLLSENTPGFSNIRYDKKDLIPIINERTSRLLFQYYLLFILDNYIQLTDNPDILMNDIQQTNNITDLISVDVSGTINNTNNINNITRNAFLSGNKSELKQKVAELLGTFIEIMLNEKDAIDISYDDIKDRIFKLREKEKDMVTDRLKNLTDEERDADTVLKIHKLNQYNKGLQKGLTVLDADYYDNELNLREEMLKTEKLLKMKNKTVNDDNIDLYLDDFVDELQIDQNITREDNDLDELEGNDDDDVFNDDNYDDGYDFDNYENENDD